MLVMLIYGCKLLISLIWYSTCIGYKGVFDIMSNGTKRAMTECQRQLSCHCQCGKPLILKALIVGINEEFGT